MKIEYFQWRRETPSQLLQLLNKVFVTSTLSLNNNVFMYAVSFEKV